jgi:hypothetical protein
MPYGRTYKFTGREGDSSTKKITRRKMNIKYDPRTEEQMQQMHHNQPRVGFTHNCYTTKLGRLFQESVKGFLERAIGKAWPLLLRYRCNGDKDKIREGKKDPDTAFVYDDPLFELLNRTLKDTARGYLTDSDAKRKQQIVCQSIDMLIMLAFEDIYYRPLLKLELEAVISAFIEHPELLELDIDETRVDAVFNGFEGYADERKNRHRAFVEEVRRRAKE